MFWLRVCTRAASHLQGAAFADADFLHDFDLQDAAALILTFCIIWQLPAAPRRCRC